MKLIKNILLWALSIFFILAGLIYILDSLLTGLIFIIDALLCNPITLKRIKFNKKLLIAIVPILFICGSLTAPTTEVDNNQIADNQTTTKKVTTEKATAEKITTTEQPTTEEVTTTEEITTTEATTEKKKINTTEKKTATTEIKKKSVKKTRKFTYTNLFHEKMQGDTTGNWRLSEIAEDIDIEKHAVDYYNTYFKKDNEVHIVLNYTRNTTTCITCFGTYLDVHIYDLVKNDDKNAKTSLGGTPLADYHVNIKTGKVEEIN